jgi:hypothetical protein
MNRYNLIVGYTSHNGGVNNLPVVKVTVNYAIAKTFTGKTALKRAKTFFNQITKK